jgi:hypothetical protein
VGQAGAGVACAGTAGIATSLSAAHHVHGKPILSRGQVRLLPQLITSL